MGSDGHGQETVLPVYIHVHRRGTIAVVHTAKPLSCRAQTLRQRVREQLLAGITLLRIHIVVSREMLVVLLHTLEFGFFEPSLLVRDLSLTLPNHPVIGVFLLVHQTETHHFVCQLDRERVQQSL